MTSTTPRRMRSSCRESSLMPSWTLLLEPWEESHRSMNGCVRTSSCRCLSPDAIAPRLEMHPARADIPRCARQAPARCPAALRNPVLLPYSNQVSARPTCSTPVAHAVAEAADSRFGHAKRSGQTDTFLRVTRFGDLFHPGVTRLRDAPANPQNHSQRHTEHAHFDE